MDSVGGIWTSAGGYITGNTAITLSAYAADNSLLGSTATPGANYVGAPTGFLPNIFLSLAFPNIDHVIFSDGGNSFTLDDFTFNPNGGAVPEPASVLCWGLIALCAARFALKMKTI